MSIVMRRWLLAGLAVAGLALAAESAARPGGGPHGAHGRHAPHLHPAPGHRHFHGGFGVWGGFLFAPVPYAYGWSAYPYGYGMAPYPYGATAYGEVPPAAWVPPPPAAPEPAFVPQAGQGAAQREADRRGCDREAMTRPDAMADAALFHRAVIDCMRSRGYAP